MAEIRVRDSKNDTYVHTLVDDCDLDFSKYKWHLSGMRYAYRKTGTSPNQKSIYLHKEILSRMFGDTGKMLGDHINQDRLDNRRSNLRLATDLQNRFNMGLSKRNKSGYLGVDYDKSRGKWRAQVGVNATAKFLGRFNSPEDAAIVHDLWVAKNRGEFGWLNFPKEFYLNAGIDILG